MAWVKAPQALADLFAESVPDDPRVERRKMFGYPCLFVAGNMCAGVFQDRIFARLSPAAAAALPGGGEFFVLDGGFAEAGETFAKDSWLRLPPGARLQAQSGPNGCRLWIKTGHLAELRGLPAAKAS